MNNVQIKLPDYKVLKYVYNADTGYYEQKDTPLTFKKLPVELKVTETQKREQIHSNYLIHGRKKGKKYLFFTGLIPTGTKDQFYGDHLEIVRGKRKKSFIIFQFSDNKRELTVYFFNHFFLFPKKRMAFIRHFNNINS